MGEGIGSPYCVKLSLSTIISFKSPLFAYAVCKLKNQRVHKIKRKIKAIKTIMGYDSITIE